MSEIKCRSLFTFSDVTLQWCGSYFKCHCPFTAMNYRNITSNTGASNTQRFATTSRCFDQVGRLSELWAVYSKQALNDPKLIFYLVSKRQTSIYKKHRKKTLASGYKWNCFSPFRPNWSPYLFGTILSKCRGIVVIRFRPYLYTLGLTPEAEKKKKTMFAHGQAIIFSDRTCSNTYFEKPLFYRLHPTLAWREYGHW